MSKRLYTVEVDKIYSMILPDAEDDPIQREIAESLQPHGIGLLEQMSARTSPGDVVIDVGANIGNVSLYMAAVAECEVFAFEPRESHRQTIEDSARLNGLADVIHVAAIDIYADISAYPDASEAVDDRVHAPALVEGQAEPAYDTHNNLRELDDFPLPAQVKLLKVEFPGSILGVLQGAEKLLRTRRPLLYVKFIRHSEFLSVHEWLSVRGYVYVDVGQDASWGSFEAAPYALQQFESMPIVRNMEVGDYDPAVVAQTGGHVLHDDVSAAPPGVSAQPSNELLFRLLREFSDRWTEQVADLQWRNNGLERQILANRAQYDDTRSKLRTVRDDRDDVRTELSKLSATLRTLKSELGKIKEDGHAQDKRSTVDRGLIARLQKQHLRDKELLSEANARLEKQSETVERLVSNLNRAETDASAASSLVVDLRNSVTYQMGLAFRKATTSPAEALKLPVRLGRLAQRHTAKGPTGLKALANIEPQARAEIVLERAGKEDEGDLCEPDELPSIQGNLAARRPGSESTEQMALSVSPLKSTSRVAAIMDEFTFNSFDPECELLQLTPMHWRSELERFSPHIVFIESAWRGAGGAWGNKVAHTSTEIRGIIDWCNSKGVPSILWNKEDPVHFSTFLNTSKLVDHVFTTDIDCVEGYKKALKHDRVYFLPFACQPALHNPLEIYKRKPAFCFAGAYYVKYPNRVADLESFVSHLPKIKPLEIYDRNFGKTDPDYQFPESYKAHIVGTLPSHLMDMAYKGYSTAINLNSVKGSQTMFARRVFELLASNTETISNYSRGVKVVFGDLVASSDSGEEIARQLAQRDGDTRFRLAALRKVMTEHTYAERLNYIFAKALSTRPHAELPKVRVLAYVRDRSELGMIVEAVERQRGVSPRCEVYTSDSELIAKGVAKDHILVEDVRKLSGLSLAKLIDSGIALAAMVPDDYYGPNYLLDLVTAKRFTSASIVGKASFFAQQQGRAEMCNPGLEYQAVDCLNARSSLIVGPIAECFDAEQWVTSLQQISYTEPSMLAMDAYNYCRNYALVNNVSTSDIDDIDVDTGVPLSELQRRAEAITPGVVSDEQHGGLSGVELALMFSRRQRSGITSEIVDDGWSFSSTLPDGKHDYLYAAELVPLEDIISGDGIDVHFETTAGLNLQLALIFFDSSGERIEGFTVAPNINSTVSPPPRAAKVKLAVRVYSQGAAKVVRVIWGHKVLTPASVVPTGEYLVVTNMYPSYDDLYRNAFVHSRIRAYRKAGLRAEVFVLRPGSKVTYREFEDVGVMTGDIGALTTLLEAARYKSLLLHFVDEAMWSVVAPFVNRSSAIIWIHGADIQPWWRREYLYQTEEEKNVARESTERKLRFWRGLIDENISRLKLVFVSESFAQTAMEDLGRNLPGGKYEVIHNPIDTKAFDYVEKGAGQRLRILSIRPFASSVYANDLTVRAILSLATESFFDQLEFRIVGDGPLFESVTEPVKKFTNVVLDRRFLRKTEIARLHKEYGVFLCPTRMDTHGVSRDEAMSSGLVPITSSVAAVPEFVDDSCGILAPAEDSEGLADAIRRLFFDEVAFKTLSRNAAQRVRKQSSADLMVEREMRLIESSDSSGA